MSADRTGPVLSMNHIVYFRTIHTRTEFRLESRYLLQRICVLLPFPTCYSNEDVTVLVQARCYKNLNRTEFEPCNFWSQRKNRLHVCVRHAFESIFNEKNSPEFKNRE